MRKFLYQVLSIVIIFLFMFPIFYTLLHSFMDEYQINNNTEAFLPERFSLHQYVKTAFNSNYFSLYLNSIFVSLGIIVGQVFISVGAAYYFSRSKSKISNVIFLIYIFIMLLPLQITLIPNVLLFNGIEKYIGIKIRDTYYALVLPGIFSTMGAFFLKQFFDSIPKTLYEGAYIDGASEFKILTNIVIPYSKNAILALCGLNFIESWNMIEQALIFIDTESKYPLSIYLNNMYTADRSVFYAGNVVFLFPVICLLMISIEPVKKMVIKDKEEL